MTDDMHAERSRSWLSGMSISDTRARHVLAMLDAAEDERDQLRTDVARLNKMLDLCTAAHTHNVALKNERDALRADVARLREERDVCVVCGDVLLPAPEPHCEGCDTEGPRYTDPE
jgi:hypothetical protein